MKPFLHKGITLLLAAVILLPAGVPSAFAETPEDWTRYPLIAHALGGIDGVDYTNSLEAFKINYDKGQRVFEIDFTLTEDGKLVARHDWLGYLADKFQQNIPENRRDVPLTLQEFKSYKILNRYTPLALGDVVRILKKYPDVYIVTDTKEMQPEVVKEQFSIIRRTVNGIDPTVIERIIPEIYSPEMMKTVKEIIPFPHVIFSIYLSSMSPDEVVQYVKDNQITVVAMPFERATRSFVQNLKKAGAVTYVHSLNKVEDARRYMNMGVHGVYTDFLSYADLGIDTSPWTVEAKPAELPHQADQAVQASSAPSGVANSSEQAAAESHTLGLWAFLKNILEEILPI